MKIQALLLAAGESKRFNGVKQLAQISGQAMLNMCIKNYLANNELIPELDSLTVVLGANAENIREHLNKPFSRNINIFEVKEWQEGMGRSISAAIAQVDADVTHVMIGLGDQIAITTKNFRLLLKASEEQPDKIISAFYANKSAVPAIFPRPYFTQLMMLSGDTGARKLLLANQEQVIPIAMPEAAIDIDSKEELNQWLNYSQ
jgi:molybdenum cofactor cytidylyltransferase